MMETIWVLKQCNWFRGNKVSKHGSWYYSPGPVLISSGLGGPVTYWSFTELLVLWLSCNNNNQIFRITVFIWYIYDQGTPKDSWLRRFDTFKVCSLMRRVSKHKSLGLKIVKLSCTTLVNSVRWSTIVNILLMYKRKMLEFDKYIYFTLSYKFQFQFSSFAL